MQYKIIIKGKVQGVFFRRFIKEKAEELELLGTVCNVPEGVEVIVQGPKEKIQELLDACEEGPPGAEVKKIETKELLESKFEDFQVVY